MVDPIKIWAPRFSETAFDKSKRTESNASAFKLIEEWTQELINGSLFPPWLFLIGPNGTGKTHMAVCAFHRTWAQRKACKVFKHLEIINRIKKTIYTEGSEDTQESAIKLLLQRGYKEPPIDLLFIDELGQTKIPTDSDFEITESLFDYLYRFEIPLIATTNYQLAVEAKETSLESMLGPRVISRIQEYGQFVLCDWESFRAMENKKSERGSE